MAAPLPLIGACRRRREALSISEQTCNLHHEPPRVTYTLPLPADGAVSAAPHRGRARGWPGDAKQRARQRFEDAILEGRTA